MRCAAGGIRTLHSYSSKVRSTIFIFFVCVSRSVRLSVSTAPRVPPIQRRTPVRCVFPPMRRSCHRRCVEIVAYASFLVPHPQLLLLCAAATIRDESAFFGIHGAASVLRPARLTLLAMRKPRWPADSPKRISHIASGVPLCAAVLPLPPPLGGCCVAAVPLQPPPARLYVSPHRNRRRILFARALMTNAFRSLCEYLCAFFEFYAHFSSSMRIFPARNVLREVSHIPVFDVRHELIRMTLYGSGMSNARWFRIS